MTIDPNSVESIVFCAVDTNHDQFISEDEKASFLEDVSKFGACDALVIRTKSGTANNYGSDPLDHMIYSLFASRLRNVAIASDRDLANDGGEVKGVSGENYNDVKGLLALMPNRSGAELYINTLKFKYDKAKSE